MRVSEDDYRWQIIAKMNDAGFTVRNTDGSVPTLKQEAAAGRAAFEASCKIALAEPTEKEMQAVWESRICVIPITVDNVRKLFANRLRSLTEPPKDAAVEAVRNLTKLNAIHGVTVEEIVAEVDKARGRA